MLMLVLDAPEDFVVAETMHCYDQCSRQLPGFVQFDLTIENISTTCYTHFWHIRYNYQIKIYVFTMATKLYAYLLRKLREFIRKRLANQVICHFVSQSNMGLQMF